jgi:hypothetical protein
MNTALPEILQESPLNSHQHYLAPLLICHYGKSYFQLIFPSLTVKLKIKHEQ